MLSGFSFSKELSPDAEVVQTACPLFVPLVENGFLKHPATKLIAEEYLSEIKSSSADTLILGCTHYPLIKPLIGDIMGSDVTLVDPGIETAHFLREYLISKNMQADRKTGECRFYVSDRVESFESVGGMFLGKEISGQVCAVNIEKYSEQ